MCGIAGVVSLEGSRVPTPERLAELERMIELIAHRGPDEAGTFVDDRVAMAAVRLSINDREHGQQPMGDADQRFFIVYNGEIYNHVELRAELEARGHRFETRCDTEVALRAWMEWGEAAPARFEGGYAFAILDRRERVVHLVRDRFGKRPLFYRAHGDAVRFGSELKVLARPELPLRWDPPRLAAIFAKWTPFGDETPFEGVRQVRAGSMVRIAPSGIGERRYSDVNLPLSEASVDHGFEQASKRLAELLGESVRLRLRSDVEVGVLLSGGLDSSVITHLVRAEQPRRVRAFSIRFADARFDESADQQRVVEALGLGHASIEVSAHDIAGAFSAALWHAEVPQFRTAFVPMFLLSKAIREAGIKVVLSGEGADETLLGYNLFKEARLRAAWSALDAEQRRARLRGLYPYLPHFSEQNLRSLEVTYARASADVTSPLASHAVRFANARFALRLLRPEPDPLAPLIGAVADVPAFAASSLVRRAQWIELHTLLQGYLLSSQGDRMAFAHGVEPRCPFLSTALVSYAAQLPERYLLSDDGDEKHLLKHAFADALPRAITAKPKQPYRAPDAASFRDPADPSRFRDWVEELLGEASLAAIEPLDAGAARRFVDKLRITASVSPREDQAFVLLLSLAVLDRQLVRQSEAPPRAARPPLRRSIDLTTHSQRLQR